MAENLHPETNKSIAQLEQELMEQRSIVIALTDAAVVRGRDNYNSVKLSWEKYDRLQRNLTVVRIREMLAGLSISGFVFLGDVQHSTDLFVKESIDTVLTIVNSGGANGNALAE